MENGVRHCEAAEARPGATGGAGESVVTFTIPVHTVSEANRASHEHWRKRQRRAKEQRTFTRQGVWAYAVPTAWPLPCTIKLTRIAPSNGLDSDNLPVSMKHVRDGIADAMGIDDRDPRVTWECAQKRGERGQYAVKVEVIG
jgi:hypothetical protein